MDHDGQCRKTSGTTAIWNAGSPVRPGASRIELTQLGKGLLNTIGCQIPPGTIHCLGTAGKLADNFCLESCAKKEILKMKPLRNGRIGTRAALFIAGLFLLSVSAGQCAEVGYLHRSGTKIVDATGQPILLSGGNTESWLLFDPFWTDGVPLSGTWNQPPADGSWPFTHSITGQLGETTGDWKKVDDSDPAAFYSPGWNQITNYGGDPGYLNSSHWSNTPGAAVSFTFTGNQVRVYGFKRSDLGIADVYIDGVLKASVDCYHATPYYNEILYTATGLTLKSHTLTVKVSGNKNAASSSVQLSMDAFGFGTKAVYGIEGNKKTWRDNKITAQDIATMAANGLNCVRVNIDARLFGTVHTTAGGYQVIDINPSAQGFDYLDKLLTWCSASHVYAILDMHIFLWGLTDSATTLESQAALWKAIAARYSTNAFVAGYDLWNEPNGADGGFSLKSNQNATTVYVHQQLINAIRQVDKNHLIFLEGVPWADRLDCYFYNPSTGALTGALQVTDPANNLAFEFHRYGGTLPDAYDPMQDKGPDGSSYDSSSPQYLWTIQHQKKLAALANLPLLCGEAGNNGNDFLQKQSLLLRRSTDPVDFGIASGMLLWHYKKPNPSGAAYYLWPFPSAGQGFDLITQYWSSLTNYWNGKGPQPTQAVVPSQADGYIHDFCASVATTQTSPEIMALLNGNVCVNGGFEADASQTPAGWNTWGANPEADSTIAGGAYSGKYYLEHAASSPYQVYTYQEEPQLVAGIYTVSAWVKSSGGQSTSEMQVKYFDGSGAVAHAPIPAAANWTKISIPNIHVTSGQCEIGFYSVATAGQWINIDNVQLNIE